MEENIYIYIKRAGQGLEAILPEIGQALDPGIA